MENKYLNEAIIGNKKILATFTQKGEMQRMYFPSKDNKQYINFFHTGVKVNESDLIYLHDDINNIYKQYYDTDTNILNTEITKNAENIILISGNKNYIEIINSNINKWLEKANIKSIKIIDFFEVTEFNNNIVNILDGHDKILNTSGEREISEVFDGYQDFKNVANNN